MIKPMLCERRPEPFNDNRYLWEIKYDGIRIIAGVQDGYSLQARSGTDKTHLFPELNLETKVSAVLDGELVCYREGKLVFNGIQHRANRINNILPSSREYPATFEVFDILMAAGNNLQNLPLEERKKILEAVLIPTDNVRVAPYTPDGISLFQEAMDNHTEGVVGKLKTGTYRQGKREWIKVKAVQAGEFVVCGYTEGTGWRASTFGALVLGKVDGTGLAYVGAVGTGFDEAEISRLYQRMLALGSAPCPFGREPEKATWIKPVISVLVQYLEMTGDDRLRFPSYKGMTN